MHNVCVIPARGGSKRLPGKNIRIFKGKPIICYTVESAIQSACFDEIIVSSDDKKILEAIEGTGVRMHQRSAELATDEAQVLDVCNALLAEMEGAGGMPSRLTVLYATAPLRDSGDIRAVVDLLEGPDCDFAMAVTDFSYSPHQALKLNENNFIEPMWPDLVDLRASEVGRFVVDNGSTYAFNVPAFKRHQTFYGPGIRCHVMPRERSVDIDTIDDWKLAEVMYDLIRDSL